MKTLIIIPAYNEQEVLYMLSYSAFANYSINTINFKVEGKDIETVKRSDLN